MRLPSRRPGMFVLLALIVCFTLPAFTFAQEETATPDVTAEPVPVSSEITVVGSGIVAPLFEAASAASGVSAAVNVIGTTAGLTALCQGSADIALATRALTVQEQGSCQAFGVQFSEILVGYNTLALITNAGDSLNLCLTADELNALFIPSAAGQVNNWTLIDEVNPDLPLTLALPAFESPVNSLLDSLVQGDGIRSDVGRYSDTNAVIEAVANTSGALGVVPYSPALETNTRIGLFLLDNGEVGCTYPSAAAANSREYLGAERLFAYINIASYNKPGVRELLNAAVDPANSGLLQSELTPLTPEAAATVQTLIANASIGRQFTRDLTAFTIPFDVAGTITIAGSADGFDYITALTGGFGQQYTSVTPTITIEGVPDGVRRLCNGELDIVVIHDNLSQEQLDNCAANNIVLNVFELGSRPVALLANGQSSYLTCLTTEQVGSLWRARVDAPATWDQVIPGAPATPVTLFAPEAADISSDLLLLETAGAGATLRTDVETENGTDANYRAAAVANVEGSLTYADWVNYEIITASGQANVIPVQIDAGQGCIAPSREALGNNTYPLARPLRLAVNQASLARTEVKSLIWSVYEDANYAALETSGLFGIDFGSLPARRDQAQAAFDAADEAARLAALAPEATAEATSDAESAFTPEASSEMTATSEAATQAVMIDEDGMTPPSVSTSEVSSEPTVEVTPAN